MLIIQSIILGIIQGITEFFPISSSGHLVVLPFIFRWDYIPLYFTVTVHFGTLIAILAVFYRDIYNILKSFVMAVILPRRKDRQSLMLGVFIIIGSIPAAVAGFLIADIAERFFSNPVMVAFFLLLTAFLLWTGEAVSKRREKPNQTAASVTSSELNYARAFIIGIGQALAVFPGVSRSGATISFGRYVGMDRKQSVRFSFLLSVPVILGSFVFEIYRQWAVINEGGADTAVFLSLGFIFSFLAGFFAIKFMLRLVEKKNLNVFAVYCVCLSALLFILYFINK
ncbi:MAG: undecaprenyl-diphosphate phosphatase [Actinomycetota bacterium]